MINIHRFIFRPHFLYISSQNLLHSTYFFFPTDSSSTNVQGIQPPTTTFLLLSNICNRSSVPFLCWKRHRWTPDQPSAKLYKPYLLFASSHKFFLPRSPPILACFSSLLLRRLVPIHQSPLSLTSPQPSIHESCGHPRAAATCCHQQPGPSRYR